MKARFFILLIRSRWHALADGIEVGYLEENDNPWRMTPAQANSP